MTSEIVTIDQAVGEYLRRFREERGLALEAVSNAARLVGARWGAASVRNLERGEASLTLEKLIHLAFVIRLLNGGEPVPLKELLGEGQRFRIGNRETGAVLSRAWLDRVLSGDPADPAEGVTAPGPYRAAQFKEKHPEQFNLPPGTTAEQIVGAVATGAEFRVSRNIGSSTKAVALWARHLWGHSLDDEARQRAGDEASPQARGRITRVLTAELSEAMTQNRQKHNG